MKRTLSLLIFASVLLTACGETAGTVETTVANGDDSSTAPVETDEFIPEKLDLGGREFIIAENDIGDWTQSAFVTEENGDVLNDSIYKRNQTVEDLYNVRIKGYTIVGNRNSQQLTELTNSILAGDKEFDIAYIPGELTPVILNNPDYLIPLTDVATLDLSHTWWDAQSVSAMTFKGNTISMTGDMVVSTTGSSTITLFSKTLAEKYKLDMYDIVNSGKFTLDKAYELAQQVQADVNGDAKFDPNDDVYGLNIEALNLPQMVLAAGEHLVSSDKNGVPSLALSAPRVTEVVQKMIAVLDDYDCVVCGQDNRMNTSNFTDMFNEDRMFLWVTNLQRMKSARSYTADFGLIPFPKYEEDDEYSAPVNPYWSSWVIVPATQNDTDTVGYVIDALGYYSQQYVTPAFIEASVTTKALRDEESAEILQSVLANKVFDAGMYFDWGYRLLYRMMQSHDANLASNLATNESLLKEKIDSFMKAFD